LYDSGDLPKEIRDLDIKPETIESLAPNASAAANGRDLARKGRLKNLRIAGGGTLLLGECSGSGKEDYAVSVDWLNPLSPVFRCTCPSRQIPCKHALGLLYAYASGASFASCDIPQDILEKREKAAKREQKKGEAPEEKPVAKKANRAALAKKIQAQIEGLGILEKVVLEIASSGLGQLNRLRALEYESQAKQLGDHYLPGAQTALRGLLLCFLTEKADEAAYSQELAELGRLYTLATRGREYLLKKVEDPEANLDRITEMEELLGNAWQLSQLIELGMVEKDVELAQLAFRCYNDDSASEFVDEGYWINFGSGAVVRTVNRRPYKAAKFIKEDDSFFRLARIPELAVYPGAPNPRVRWEEMAVEELLPQHFERILLHAKPSFAETAKAVRNVLKDPLGLRFPAFLLIFKQFGTVGEVCVAENAAGERLVLADAPNFPPCVENLCFLGQYENAAVLGVFHQEPGGGALRLHPLSVVHPGGIIRLG
jgi:hypothetical protein